MDISSKVCTKCGEKLPVSNFFKRKDAKCGYRSHCKGCTYIRTAAYSKENRKHLYEKALEHRLNNPVAHMLKSAKRRASKYGRDFDLNPEDIVIPDRCPVLGVKMESAAGEGARNVYAPSLDRIDNSKGYVKGNVAVISLRANLLKSDATLEELEKLVSYARGYIK